MHRLLQRQLRKCFGQIEGFSPELQQFIQVVHDAYVESESDRALMERSMELSSNELLGRNEELARAEEKYRAIFENASEAIFQITTEGRFISANPAMARICGYQTADELSAAITNALVELYAKPEQRAQTMAAIERDGAACGVEAEWRRRDGTAVWVVQNIRVAKRRDGHLFYEGTAADISKRKHAEAEREELQKRLLTISRQSGMAEVATGVLHNVGNVLNSVNTSANLLMEKLSKSEIATLQQVIQLIASRQDDLVEFLSSDERGKRIPRFLSNLGACLQREHEIVLAEFKSLVTGVNHIKQVVSAQQSLAKSSAFLTSTSPTALFEDALKMQAAVPERQTLAIVRQFQDIDPLPLDQHKVLQILINLIGNARQACLEHCPDGGRITLTTSLLGEGPDRRVRFRVDDNGMGIEPQNLARIFAHGFTTKSSGHGFGLHSAANAATEMNGTLTAHSAGRRAGTSFLLDLPVLATTRVAA